MTTIIFINQIVMGMEHFMSECFRVGVIPVCWIIVVIVILAKVYRDPVITQWCFLRKRDRHLFALAVLLTR